MTWSDVTELCGVRPHPSFILTRMKRLLARLSLCVLAAAGLYVVSGFSRTVISEVASGFSRTGFAADQQCVDHSKDPAGCQPSTFDTPMAQMPSVRVNRQGNVDPFSSEEEARAGARALESQL